MSQRRVELGLRENRAQFALLVAEDELRRGELVRFEVAGAGAMRRSVYLLRPDGREPTPSERAFIQTLCSCCDAAVAGCTAV